MNRDQRYNASKKGKARNQRYEATEAAKERVKRYRARLKRKRSS